MKLLTLSTIQQEFSDLIVSRIGDDCEILGFGSVDLYQPGDLIFLDAEQVPDSLFANPPAAIVTTSKLAENLSANKELGVLVCEDVRLAHALIRQRYDDDNLHEHEWPRIHPSAVIHESVQLPDSVTVGPGSVIGCDTRLGERLVVQANVVIENNVKIGDDSLIQSSVFIGRGAVVGKRVIIKPGSIIGAEGFGFSPDQDKHFHRVPQKGIVVVEDDVVIGSNCNIDRATYGETRISRGTKLDALCHIAHNVFIDKDCIVVAQTGVAGSSRLGKRVIVSGQSAISDHKTVTDDVVLVHRCGVTEDILEPGMYAATPAQPFNEYIRNIAIYHKLHKLRHDFNSLAKQVKKLVTGSS